MNVILLNHYAGNPEMGMEFRPYYLAREWVKMGHHVRIVAGDFSHLRMINPKVERDFSDETKDGITYTWIKTGQYNGNGVKRAFSMFRFVGKLWVNARVLADKWKPDVIIASSTYPLDTYAAQRIKKYSGAKYIHEVHDMWPITLIEIGNMKKMHPFVIIMQRAENSFCRNSDLVVSLLCNAKFYFIKHGMSPNKFRNIMNGVSLEEWKNPEPLPEQIEKTIKELKEDNKFLICFFGSITKSYAISYLIKAIQNMQDSRIALIVVGEGEQKEELMELARRKMKDNFIFFPKIPKRSIPTLLKEMDCLYIAALHNAMFRFGIGMNKLFDSMMSGKPILYAVDAPNNFIEEYHCGISVKAENKEELTAGLIKMLSLTEEERSQMGERGRRAVLEHFTYDKLAAQFAELFD